MNKLGNYLILTRQSLANKASGRWLLFFCAFIAGGWSGLSAPWNFWLAANVHAASSALTPIVRQAERIGLSSPLRDIEPAKSQTSFAADGAQREIPLRRFRRTRVTSASDTKEVAPSLDPVVQSFAPAPKTPAPTVTFEGVSNADNGAEFGPRYQPLPPDTVGDVGPDHYVQVVNTLMQVFSKTGTSLLGPLPISTIFAGFGGHCQTDDDGDAIVLYDHLANRWLISQFAAVFVGGPPFHQCIAISQTGDPTGAYFRYDFTMPKNKLNDYPKFGVWPDAYYMSDNQFDVSDNFVGAGVFAFERDKMLIGAPASVIYFDLETVDSSIGGLLPADLDGPAPPAGTPNYFAYFTATEFGDAQDGLRIFEFHADFTTPVNSTFTEHGGSPLPTAAFSPVLCSDPFLTCIPQRGTKVKVDSLADRLMFRLQYRNFGTHESLVTNHTVNAGNGKAGIRYYELRATSPGGNFVVNEQATFAPGTVHRWMGSAAMDSAGNLAVGYSASGTLLFPSIRYASRLASDPPGGLFQGEATLQAGAGSQRSDTSRWGDYSALSVDPVDDCTFWYTQEYYATTSERGWQTKIGSFRLSGCIHDLAVVKMTANATVKGPGPVTAGVAVEIQNRSDHPEVIDSGDLGNGVSSGLVRLNVTVVDPGNVEVCQPAGVVLDAAKNTALFSAGAKVLKPKKLMTVNFLVAYNCTSPQPLNKADLTRGDYQYVATVHHDALDGNADGHSDDDACPHDALPGNLDPNPPLNGVKDRGCGGKITLLTFGAPVQTDVIQ